MQIFILYPPSVDEKFKKTKNTKKETGGYLNVCTHIFFSRMFGNFACSLEKVSYSVLGKRCYLVFSGKGVISCSLEKMLSRVLWKRCYLVFSGKGVISCSLENLVLSCTFLRALHFLEKPGFVLHIPKSTSFPRKRLFSRVLSCSR
jgi:hypothetical protein